MSSAVLDNREKVAKINAELARLELEMEMDHAGDLGPGAWDALKGLVGLGDSDDTKKAKKAALDTAETTFNNNILTPVGTKASVAFAPVAVDNVKKLMNEFQDKGSGSDADSLKMWRSKFNSMEFHIIFRHIEGRSEYSVVSIGKEATKKFSMLEYTTVVSVDGTFNTAVDNLIVRIMASTLTIKDLSKLKG